MRQKPSPKPAIYRPKGLERTLMTCPRFVKVYVRIASESLKQEQK